MTDTEALLSLPVNLEQYHRQKYESMTVAEAKEALKTPRFGDTRCIVAREVLIACEELKSARWLWESPDGLDAWDKGPALVKMNLTGLNAELSDWRKLGWNGKDFA
jgi:hypothetical protein